MISAPRVLASLAAFSLLTACGLKGPLTLPPKEPAQTPAPEAAAKPAEQEKPEENPPKPVSVKKLQSKKAADSQTQEAEVAKPEDSGKPEASPEDATSLEEPPSSK